MTTISESFVHMAQRFEHLGQKHIFDHAGLSSVSAKILFVISRKRTISPSTLHKAIGGTMSNISQRLAYLEKKGFIVRQREIACTDKRKASFILTPLGRKKISVVKRLLKKGNVCIEKHFTQKEIADHFAFCKKLHHILDTAEQNGIKNFLT